jgi:uncharacterized protein (UPF0332 family)
VKPSDFLRTARLLANTDTGRPQQVNLRRACSSTYYALFHTLCTTCARLLVGPQKTRRAWCHVYRSVDHRVARESCARTEFIQRFPNAVQDFASVFVQMQIARHTADYDPDAQFRRSSVAADIEAVAVVMSAFHRVPARHRRAFAIYVILGRPRS